MTTERILGADPDALSRRGLLRIGLLGAAVLATAGIGAGLSGCSAERPGHGLAALRDTDLPFLRAALPVLLEGAVAPAQMDAAVDSALAGLDDSLARFSPALRDLTLQLFDVLVMPVTRGPLTGVWGRWENASATDIRRFLERWRNSSIGLLNRGHASLLQLVALAWYGNPQAWRHCGYPGPPSL